MPGRAFDLAALLTAAVVLAAAGELVVRRRLARAQPPLLILGSLGLLTLAALFGAAEPLLPDVGRYAGIELVGSGLLAGGVLLLLATLFSLQRHERPAADEGAVDPLTRVASHRAFQDRLLHECERAYRFGDSFALLLLDVDQFQLLNTQCGHTSGDRILFELAQRLRSLVRDIDLCARFGGDQFVVVLPHTLGHGGVRTAERLRQSVAAWTFLTPANHEARLTASLGLAFYPDDGRTPPELVDAAKRSIAFAKSLGGNQVQVFRDIGDEYGDEKVVNLHASSHGTIVRSLAAAVDVRDRYTHSHSNLVSELAAATARRMGMRGGDLGRVRVGALLHDVGKIGIPDAVLSKEGPLTPQEWSIVRRHPVLGKTIIEQAPELRDLIPMVLYHQERFDGSGYPEQLSGESIPLEARIVAAADAYHAIRSDRPYRSGRTHHEAIQELLRCAGTQFDPKVVNALISALQTDEGLQTAMDSPKPRRRIQSGDPLSQRPAAVPLGGTA